MKETCYFKLAVCTGNHYYTYLGLDLISLWLSVEVCYPVCAKWMPCLEIILLPLTKEINKFSHVSMLYLNLFQYKLLFISLLLNFLSSGETLITEFYSL